MKGRNSPGTIHRLHHLLIFIIPLLVQSCSVGDYLGAYFNTYFNASRLFAEAETEIETQLTTARVDTTFLPDYKLQPATKTKLTSVIEKCSKILQYHAESSLVDNSLMMIGKSYYYQNDHQQAERKFAELIEGYPESGLRPEAQLLLANTYYRMRDQEKALEIALRIADSTGGDDEAITGRAFLLLGQIHYENQEYQEAKRAYGFAAEYAGSADEQVSAYMRKAIMSRRIGEFRSALEAYEHAEDASRTYTGEYHAKIGQAKMLVTLEDYSGALSVLEDLRSNTNFKEFYGEVDLEIGNTLRMSGDFEEAIEQYYHVDTTYSRTDASAESHYQLGYLYETEFKNLDSALAVYTRGRGQSPRSPYSPIMIRRTTYLKNYKALIAEIAVLESLMTLILNPDLQPGDSVAVNDASDPSDTSQTASVPPLPTIDSVHTALADKKAGLGALFYSSIEEMDSAKFWYEALLRDHPGTEHSPRALYTIAQIYELDESVGSETTNALYREIIEDYPETAFADEARRILGYPPREEAIDEAAELYSYAELTLSQGYAGEAINIFEVIATDYSSSPMAAKARYAIAWIYEQQTINSDSAIVHYRKLVNQYPSTKYAALATTRLKEVPETPPEIPDTSALGTETVGSDTSVTAKTGVQEQSTENPPEEKPEEDPVEDDSEEP